MKRIKLISILIHIYMFMTVVSAIFLPHDIIGFLFDLGASSWLIGVVAGSAEMANGFVYALLFFWGCSLPALLIVFYILACKKIYTPFTVIATIDAIVVLLWTISRLVVKDMYAFNGCITDAIVSAVFVITLITCLCIEKSSKKTVLGDDEYEKVDGSLSLELPSEVERSTDCLRWWNKQGE